MSRSEDIDNAIWDEADFYALSAPAKLVYIWSWTNRRCDFSGIYQVPLAAISAETGHDLETVTASLEELERAEFVFYDGTWLFVKARVKRIRTRTVQMCKAIAKDLLHVPVLHPFREQLLSLYGDARWWSKGQSTSIRETLETLSGGTGVGPGNDATEPNTGYDPDGTGVLPRTGTGTRTRTGTKGWGAGRGGGVYVPTAEALRLREQHFPDDELGAIDGALVMLRGRGMPTDPRLVGAMLHPDDETVAAA